MEKFNDFLKNYPPKCYRRGEMILFGDETPEYVHFIIRGYVKIYSIDNQGNEKLITFDRENEFFPIGWTFAKNESSPFYYEAFTDCDIALIPRDEHQHFLHQHPDEMEQMFSSFINRYMDLSGRVNSLVQTTAAIKLGYTLRFMGNRFGERQGAKRVIKNFPLTQQALASFTGLTRETINLELRKMQELGVLKYNRRRVVIDSKKLMEYIGEDK